MSRFPWDNKIQELKGLQALLGPRRQLGQKVVFTNGCFDLLHVGHLDTLACARSLGDILVVGLNADISVRALKGPRRPLQSENERAQLLAALLCVDFVILFSEDTPLKLLAELRPDIHVKGGDYEAAQLPETPLVLSWGGRVHIAPIADNRSTSRLEAALQE